jgi:hypothetical protein
MLELGTAEHHVALTGRVSEWLRRTGVHDADARATLAVGFVDSLAAARHVAADLESLLHLDPDHPAQQTRLCVLRARCARGYSRI